MREQAEFRGPSRRRESCLCVVSKLQASPRARRPRRSCSRARAACRPRGPAASTSCGRRPRARLEPPVDRDRQLDAEPRRRPPRTPRGSGVSSSTISGSVAELAERRAGERGDRVERDVADQLEPDLARACARSTGAFSPPASNAAEIAAAALARRAVGLADREARALDVADHAGLDDLGRAVDDAADDASPAGWRGRSRRPGRRTSSTSPCEWPP